MNILFVKPPYKVAGFYGLGDRYVPTPLAEAHLIAYLKQFNYKPEMLDCHKLDIEWEDLPAKLKAYKPDMICFSASMAAFHHSYIKFIDLAKEACLSAVIVAGGTHISLVGEDVFKTTKNLDFIVYGEGEVTLLELIRAIENGKKKFDDIDGLQFSKDGKFIKTKPRAFIEDIDTLPDPDLDVLIQLENNRFSLFPEEWDKWTLLVTGRGCPGNCTFCTARITQGPYRYVSAERAFNLIKKVYDRGVRTVWIDDLTFPVNRKRTEKLLDLLIEADLGLNLVCLSTIPLIIRDKDIMYKYKKAGIQGILLGAESPLEKDQLKYNKKISTTNIQESVDILKANDILSWVFYMIGDVEHTKEDIIEIFNFADKIDSTVAVFGPATPFPGTLYHQQLLKDKLIKITDYQYYDMTYAVMDTKHISMEDVQSVKDGLAIMYFQKPERIEANLSSNNIFIRHWYERLKKYVNSLHIHGTEKQRIPSLGIIADV